MGSRRSRPTYKVTMTGRPSSPEIEVKKHSQPIFSPIRLDAVSLLLKVRQASPKLNKESNPVNRILRALLKVVSSGKTRPSKGPSPDECRHSLRISQGDVRKRELASTFLHQPAAADRCQVIHFPPSPHPGAFDGLPPRHPAVPHTARLPSGLISPFPSKDQHQLRFHAAL